MTEAFNNSNRERSGLPKWGKQPYPTAEEVNDFHHNASVDNRPEDIHHRIGRGGSAAHEHYHNGDDSPQLLANITITGSRSTATATVLNQLINALSALGVVNATSP